MYRLCLFHKGCSNQLKTYKRYDWVSFRPWLLQSERISEEYCESERSFGGTGKVTTRAIKSQWSDRGDTKFIIFEETIIGDKKLLRTYKAVLHINVPNPMWAASSTDSQVAKPLSFDTTDLLT